jgi:hypothetical protein
MMMMKLVALVRRRKGRICMMMPAIIGVPPIVAVPIVVLVKLVETVIWMFVVWTPTVVAMIVLMPPLACFHLFLGGVVVALAIMMMKLITFVLGGDVIGIHDIGE